MRSGNDNLIVERKRIPHVVEKFTSGTLSTLQYGDKVIVDCLDDIGDTVTGFTDGIFTAITNGVDIIDRNGQILIDKTTRAAIVPIVVTQRIIANRQYASHRIAGIKRAKKNGKYAGRKPIEVDEEVLRQVR